MVIIKNKDKEFGHKIFSCNCGCTFIAERGEYKEIEGFSDYRFS